MPFDPTVFIDQADPLNGDPADPRVDAAELNKLGTQYAQAVADAAAAANAAFVAQSMLAGMFGLLDVGQETLPRQMALSGTGMTSGVRRITFIKARKSETVASITVATSTTAAGATPTLARIGLHSVASNGDLTSIASTPNDTTLFAAQNTVYTKALSSPVAVVKGQWYAVEVLVVTSTTPPTLVSSSALGNIGAEWAKSPRIAAALTGQTDLTTPVLAGTLVATASMIYAVLNP